MPKRLDRRRARSIAVTATAASFFTILAVAYLSRQRLAQVLVEAKRPAVPTAVSAEDFAAKPAASVAAAIKPTTEEVLKPAVKTPVAAKLPNEINLAVPFTIQAPHANWVQPYEDGCEEASAAMVNYYYADKTFVSADAADAELKELFAWEDATFGTDKDADSEQVARLLREQYGYRKVVVRYDVTAEDIRSELRAGRPVILPAYGKGLNNPYFKNGGPVYHMLVVKGYIGDDRFVTNDPGTRRGADYVYSVKTIMDSLHDWNGGDVPNGRRAIIVVYPN